MDNYGFTHYYGRHKKPVRRSNVVQSEKKQFRIGGDLLREYNRHKKFFAGSESEFIRELIKEGIKKFNQEEISDI